MKNTTKGIWILIGLFIGLPVIAVWSGYATMLLWNWFFVPLGLPIISLLHAVAIDITISYITGIHSLSTMVAKISKEITDESYPSMITKIIVTPGLAILIGLILKGLI